MKALQVKLLYDKNLHPLILSIFHLFNHEHNRPRTRSTLALHIDAVTTQQRTHTFIYIYPAAPPSTHIPAQPCKSIQKQNFIFIFHVLIGQVPQSANTLHPARQTGA